MVFRKTNALSGLLNNQRNNTTSRLTKYRECESPWFRGLMGVIDFQVDVNERTAFAFFTTVIGIIGG